jgi:hypothetical protein
MNPKRELAPIPPDPKPTEKEIAAYRRKQDGWNWNGGVSKETRLQMAEFEWRADKKDKEPNLFWWPFAPLEGYQDYLDSTRPREKGSGRQMRLLS